MAIDKAAEKRRLVTAAKLLSNELSRQHLRSPFRLKHTFNLGNLYQSGTGGWYVTIATWGKGRPAIELFLDRILHSKLPQFWYGFSSERLDEIKRLIKQMPESFSPSRYYYDKSCEMINDDISVFKRPPSDKDITRPICEFYNDSSSYYFGMYDIQGRSNLNLLASQATEFITFVVNRVSAPSPPVGKGGFIHRLIRDRQPAFRNTVLQAYGGKCCVTGCAVRDCLEAAHIDRYSKSGNNSVTNGIPLRADLHRLFDAKLLTFFWSGDKILLKVNKSIQDEAYRDLTDKVVKLPANRSCWPKLIERQRKTGGRSSKSNLPPPVE